MVEEFLILCPQSGVDGFEKIFGTPHNLDLEKVSRWIWSTSNEGEE